MNVLDDGPSLEYVSNPFAREVTGADLSVDSEIFLMARNSKMDPDRPAHHLAKLRQVPIRKTRPRTPVQHGSTLRWLRLPWRVYCAQRTASFG